MPRHQMSAPEYHEKKLQCPYEPSHMIAGDKMLKHLYKCKKAILLQPTHPQYTRALDLKECRWSALHRIPSKDLADHEGNCPDQRFKDSLQLLEDQASAPTPGWVNCVDNSALDRMAEGAATGGGDNWDDNWDDDAGTGGYDPSAKVENNPQLIFNPQGLTRAQKRDFRHDRGQRASDWQQHGVYTDDYWGSNPHGQRTQQQQQQPKTQKNSSNVLDPPKASNVDDEWTTVPVGRGRGKRRPQDSAVFDNVVRGLSEALPPPVAPLGRGKGRGVHNK